MAFWDKWRKENKEPRETEPVVQNIPDEEVDLEEEPAAASVEAVTPRCRSRRGKSRAGGPRPG